MRLTDCANAESLLRIIQSTVLRVKSRLSYANEMSVAIQKIIKNTNFISIFNWILVHKSRDDRGE